MEWGLATALALVALVAAWVLGRSRGARHVAESSGALAAADALARDARERLDRLHADLAGRHDQIAALRAENASLAQDNRWLGDEIRARQAGTGVDAGAPERCRPEAARHVSVAGGRGAQRQPLVVSRPGAHVVRGLPAAHRRNPQASRRHGSATSNASASPPTRASPSRSPRSAPPRARCRGRCARRRCAAAGARCSCAASSRWRACCSAATSTSSRDCRPRTAACGPT